jgi:hypothetical protein
MGSFLREFCSSKNDCLCFIFYYVTCIVTGVTVTGIITVLGWALTVHVFYQTSSDLWNNQAMEAFIYFFVGFVAIAIFVVALLIVICMLVGIYKGFSYTYTACREAKQRSQYSNLNIQH